MRHRFLSLGVFPLILTICGGCPQPTAEFDALGGSGTIAAAGESGASSTPNLASPGGSERTDGGNGTAGAIPSCTEPDQAAQWTAEVLRLVNQERAANGLNPVVNNDVLALEAANYACELIEYDFFAHVNPVTGGTLRDRAAQFDYEFQVIGENLAAGQQSPQRAMRDWMNSPGHRENILHPDFTELGVAVKLGGDYGIVWVQEFGRPAAR